MSLLMEALRKAEEAKRKSQEQEGTLPVAPRFSLAPREPEPVRAASTAPGPGLEPAQAPPALDGTGADTLSEQDPDPVDAPRSAATSAGAAGRDKPRNSQARDRLTAASVFAAKQQTASARTRSRLGLLLGLGLGLACAGGGTLWYLLQAPASSNVLLEPALVDADPAWRAPAAAAAPDTGSETRPVTPGAGSAATAAGTAAAPTPDATTASPDAAVAAAAAAEPILAGGADGSAALPLPATAPAAGMPPASPPAPTPPAPAAATAAAPGAEVNAGGSNASGIQIRRSSGRSELPASLQAAWSALQAGDLQRAALLYREVLAEQPDNRDALLGLAAIELQQHNPAAATQLYTRALSLNPQDAWAQAGLLQATRSGSGPAYEAELRTLLQRHPGMAPLHFALGNHYAGQQRWSEAQAAYFEALLQARRDSSTPVSPDYAFNLAVSLERLQQTGAALTYYREAETLSRSSQPGFDPALLQSRIAALQEQTQP